VKIGSIIIRYVVLGLGSWALAASPGAGPGDTPALAAEAINSLGLDLLAHGTEPGANAVLSPYSIQSTLAMTYAGAAGKTHAEMARVLHYRGEEAELHRSFAALQTALDGIARRTAEWAKRARQRGEPSEGVTLTAANRLFGQEGYPYRAPFLALAKDMYRAPFQPLDFAGNWSAAREEINRWVGVQTRGRIEEIVPADGVSTNTRLVLVNAIYLKAPWAEAFPAEATMDLPFHVRGGKARAVPTMVLQRSFGYGRRAGFTVVTVPYRTGELQLLILLPSGTKGLAALEKQLTARLLVSCANPDHADLILYLPKLKIEPELFRLGKVLQSLGMKSAFDVPSGTANFERMAPRLPDQYLCISEVFHKTFMALDEKGTEAAAATAAEVVFTTGIAEPTKPITVRVDHPFFFAIQHRPSGACLFLGRVTDPR